MKQVVIKSDDPMTAAFQALAAGKDLRNVEFKKVSIDGDHNLSAGNVKTSTRTKGKHYKIKPGDKKKLKAMNDKKMLMTEMAKEFGVNRTSIAILLNKFGIEYWREIVKLDDAEIDNVKKLIAGGMSCLQVSKHYGCKNPNAAGALLERHGLKVSDLREPKTHKIDGRTLRMIQNRLNWQWKKSAIAKEFGVSVNTIFSLIQQGKLHRNCNNAKEV